MLGSAFAVANSSLRRCASLSRAAQFVVLAAVALGLSGCQTITGTTATSQFRVIDTSPDAPGLDIYEGKTAVTYNMGFGTQTSYIGTAPGTYTISATSAGSTTTLTSATGTFVTNGSYTVLIGNAAASLQEKIVTDRNQPAPSGQVSLRVLDQATKVGAVDVYLVPSGSTITAVTPVAQNVTFSSNTGYLNVPVGTYTLYLLPAGSSTSVTPTYSGTATAYTSGSARTLLLIDQQLLTTPGFNVIILEDYDSPTATS